MGFGETLVAMTRRVLSRQSRVTNWTDDVTLDVCKEKTQYLVDDRVAGLVLGARRWLSPNGQATGFTATYLSVEQTKIHIA